MDVSNEKIIGRVIDIPNDDILPNRFQPRKYFDEADTLELAESIKEHGILQPIVVRKVGDKYEIIAGERRYKANILAGNDSIPAIISNLNDKESSEIAVIENIQRQNLTPIEEAISYKRIIDMGYVTQEDLAKKVGKSQSAIANKIRLLKLSDNVQEALMEKRISERHARSLLKLESLKKQDELLERIINERLTVRKTDEEINKMNNNIYNNMPNINQPQNIPVPNTNFNPFEQQPNLNQMPEQPMETPVQSVEQQVSPIMGTPVSTFNESVNQEAQTPSFEIPASQSAGIQQPFSQSVQEQPSEQNIFNQPFSQPVQQMEPQPQQTNYNIPSFEQTQSIEPPIKSEIQDEPLASTPVTEFTNQPNFLDVEPIETNNKIDDNIINNQQFNNYSSAFNMPINNNIETTNSIETPTFQPEQPIETNIGMATPVVDLNTPLDPVPTNNTDIPLTNTIPSGQTNDPIIVTNDDTQFDPIMPEQPNNEPTLDFKTIINLIRQCSETIEKCGYKIDTEEYDLEGKYQVTFTIEK